MRSLSFLSTVYSFGISISSPWRNSSESFPPPHQQTGFLSGKGEQRKRIIRASDWLRARPIFRRPAFWHRFRREENRSETRVEAISAHARHPPFATLTVKMACMSATNALAARASAVRTNKRCVPTDKPHPGKLVFPREHRDDTRASVPNGVFRRARTRLPRSRATRVPTRRLSRDERQDLARAQRPPGASNRRPRDAARALRRIAPGVRFAVPRGRVFARFPARPPRLPRLLRAPR